MKFWSFIRRNFAEHGKPEFSFFASEQEMAAKIRNGFPADITLPCTGSWTRMDDGGLRLELC